MQLLKSQNESFIEKVYNAIAHSNAIELQYKTVARIKFYDCGTCANIPDYFVYIFYVYFSFYALVPGLNICKLSLKLIISIGNLVVI